jgi:hypothetical protein
MQARGLFRQGIGDAELGGRRDGLRHPCRNNEFLHDYWRRS